MNSTASGRILAEGFQSINSQETKSKAALIKQVAFFWTLIPDLVWEPKDMVIGAAWPPARRGAASWA
jgi:hypothetical protein